MASENLNSPGRLNVKGIPKFFLNRPWTWPLVLTSLLILVIALLLLTASRLSFQEDQARLKRVHRVIRESIENALYSDQDYLTQVASATYPANRNASKHILEELTRIRRTLAVYSNLVFIDPDGTVQWSLKKLSNGSLLETPIEPLSWLQDFRSISLLQPTFFESPLPPNGIGLTIHQAIPVRNSKGFRGNLVASYESKDLLECCVSAALLKRFHPVIESESGKILAWPQAGELEPRLGEMEPLHLLGTNIKLHLNQYAWNWNNHLILLALACFIIFTWLTISTFYQAWIIRRLQKATDLLGNKQSELSAISQNSPDIVASADCNGMIKYINRAAAGLRIDDVIGSNVGDYFDEPYLTMFRTALRKTVEDKEIQAIETVSKSGLPYSMRLAPVINNGKVSDVVIISTPTTALKQAEQQLRLTQFAIDRSIFGALLIDVTGKFKFVNETAARTLGYTQEELLSMSVFNFSDGAKAGEKWNSFWGRLRNETKSERFETTVKHKNGQTLPVMITGNFFEYNGAEYVWAFIRDVTEEKEIATQLVNAKEQAEAANRSKSEFLANMSHEIRTPMSAILGFTQLLRDHFVTPKKRYEYIATIQRNGQHLLKIIEDILDLSKIEAGQVTIEQKSFNPKVNIEEAIDMVMPNILSKGLRLRVHFGENLPKIITSDPHRFRQVLMNIIGNSIKFTSRGYIDVTATYLTETSKLEVVVADTGIGIDEKQMARLFQPFAQANTSVSRDYGGSGLGLILSRRYARALGGDVEIIESKLGKGSKFKISIDAGEAEVNENVEHIIEHKEHTESDNSAWATTLSGLNVLIVDDGPDNQLLISHILQGAGAAVDLASTGLEGVQKALAKGYDVIFMDIQMPELDGYAATSMLRKSNYSGPILALTAHAMVGERDRCLAAGCNDYLTKPIDFDHLVACSAKWGGMNGADIDRGQSPLS